MSKMETDHVGLLQTHITIATIYTNTRNAQSRLGFSTNSHSNNGEWQMLCNIGWQYFCLETNENEWKKNKWVLNRFSGSSVLVAIYYFRGWHCATTRQNAYDVSCVRSIRTPSHLNRDIMTSRADSIQFRERQKSKKSQILLFLLLGGHEIN